MNAGRHLVDIVIPVYNEERDLGPSVRRLHDYAGDHFPLATRITIVDNGSTDATWRVALHLARTLAGVRAIRLAEKGRGRALRAAWSRSDADVVAYMDVDLSTDLNALLPLVAPLVSGHSDVAIGSRLLSGARVTRGSKRELISRAYNLLLRSVLRTRIADAQCGFKALRADAAHALLPYIQDNSWFFDTELLVLARRAGMRITQVPVDWVDDPDSRVDLLRTARDDLAGVARLAWSGANEMARFALVGLLSTAAYVALFMAARAVMPLLAANTLALLTTAVANTAANRRFTFGVRERRNRLQHQGAGLVALVIGLSLTTGAAAAMTRVAPHSSRTIELGVLLAVNLVATVVRYAVLRRAIAPAEPRQAHRHRFPLAA